MFQKADNTELAEIPVKKRGNPSLQRGGPSLNPRGRAKGSKNSLTVLQNELIRQFADEMNKDFMSLIKVIIKKAKGGDMTAAKMLLDRALPARKAVEHYGAHEGMGGINIIIRGIGEDPVITPVIEGTFETIYDDEDEDDE